MIQPINSLTISVLHSYSCRYSVCQGFALSAFQLLTLRMLQLQLYVPRIMRGRGRRLQSLITLMWNRDVPCLTIDTHTYTSISPHKPARGGQDHTQQSTCVYVQLSGLNVHIMQMFCFLEAIQTRTTINLNIATSFKVQMVVAELNSCNRLLISYSYFTDVLFFLVSCSASHCLDISQCCSRNVLQGISGIPP